MPKEKTGYLNIGFITRYGMENARDRRTSPWATTFFPTLPLGNIRHMLTSLLKA